MQWPQLIIVIGYTIVLFVLAIKGRKKTINLTDYLIGGWGIPWVLAACVILGDWLGATASIGVGQTAYEKGIGGISYSIGLGTGLIVLALVFSRKLRSFKCITVPEVMGTLFDSRVRILSSVVMVSAYFIITSVQFLGGGAIIAQLTNLSLSWGIVITVAITLLILLSGGIWSIGFTNVLNVVVLYVGLIVGTIFTLQMLGGWKAFSLQLPERFLDPFHIGTSNFFAIVIVGFLSAFVGQAALMGIFGAKTPEVARRATLFAGVLFIPVGLLCTILGMAARLIYGSGLPSSVQAIPAVVLAFPPVLSMVVFVSLWALMLSTTGPVLFALTQIVIRDIVPVVVKGLSEKKTYLLSRLMVIFLGFSCCIASFTILHILRSSMFAFTVRNGLAIAFFLAIIFGSRRSWVTSPGGVLCAVLAGFVTTTSWVLILNRPWGLHEIYPTVVIFIIVLFLVNFSKRTFQKGKKLKNKARKEVRKDRRAC